MISRLAGVQQCMLPWWQAVVARRRYGVVTAALPAAARSIAPASHRTSAGTRPTRTPTTPTALRCCPLPYNHTSSLSKHLQHERQLFLFKLFSLCGNNNNRERFTSQTCVVFWYLKFSFILPNLFKIQLDACTCPLISSKPSSSTQLNISA